MQRVFQQVITYGPTLAANHNACLTLPFDAQLVHVSASNSTANAGKIDVGTVADNDLYLDNKNFGVSMTPAEYDLDDFVGAVYPHVAKGTDIRVTVTDHVSHMANVCVVLTWTEG